MLLQRYSVENSGIFTPHYKQILLTKLFKIHNSLFLSTKLEGSYNLKIMQLCYTSVNLTAPLPTARAKGVNKGHVSIHGHFQFVPDQYRLHISYLVLGFFHLMAFFLSSTMQDKKHQITFLHPFQISCIILLAVCRSANPITECQSSFHPLLQDKMYKSNDFIHGGFMNEAIVEHFLIVSKKHSRATLSAVDKL